MKICFIINLPTQFIGGSELQCYLIAKGLLAKGWDISYIAGLGIDNSQVGIIPEGFHVYDLPHREWLGGWRRYSRAFLMLNILRHINPDIVFVGCPEYVPIIADVYCRLYRKKFVYYAGSLIDADLTNAMTMGWVDTRPAQRLSGWGLQDAELIVTNAKWISDAFRKKYPNKTIRTIQNGQEIGPPTTTRKNAHFLWLARMHPTKNPSAYIRLAKELPRLKFIMAGSGPLHQQITKEASPVHNLTLTGFIHGVEKTQLIESSIALVNTSRIEGFPNTLIEAGISSVPYISFVDPDEVICKHELGYHVRSFEELVEKTELLATEPELRRRLGMNNRHYVEKEHSVDTMVSKYDTLLRKLI